jgi:hypothetical protein
MFAVLINFSFHNIFPYKHYIKGVVFLFYLDIDSRIFLCLYQGLPSAVGETKYLVSHFDVQKQPWHIDPECPYSLDCALQNRKNIKFKSILKL